MVNVSNSRGQEEEESKIIRSSLLPSNSFPSNPTPSLQFASEVCSEIEDDDESNGETIILVSFVCKALDMYENLHLVKLNF